MIGLVEAPRWRGLFHARTVYKGDALSKEDKLRKALKREAIKQAPTTDPTALQKIKERTR